MLTKIVHKLCKYIINKDYRFIINASLGFYNHMDDEKYLKRKFKAVTGKVLDLDNPKTFSEKLQWLKLYNRNPKYTILVDKYRVREYIAQTLGEEYLIPLLGVWDKPEDIDFDKLPDQFVLKCNHNSGLGMCICKDKSKIDQLKVIKELRKGIRENFYLKHREWPYKDVPRKIIAEQFMTEDSGAELMDYKIHCFNGKPEFILVCSDRFSSSGLKEDFYDTNWNLLDIKRPTHPNSENGIQKPELLNEMLRLAGILAKDLPFSRIDFYVINSKIYFGEITFFPTSGFEAFEPESADEWIGQLLDLKTRI